MDWPPTVEEIKAFTRNELPTVDDDFIAEAITAAVDTFSDETQRQVVEAGPTATTRLFVPSDPYLLRIHDCVAVTSVLNDGVALSVYQLEPVNGINRTGQHRPFDRIRLTNGTVWYHDAGRATVAVTARWGWATIPPRAVEAVKLITKDIIENRDVKLGVIAVSEAGAVSARMNSVVRKTIDAYRAVESWGIA